jgi:hypothetical protein
MQRPPVRVVMCEVIAAHDLATPSRDPCGVSAVDSRLAPGESANTAGNPTVHPLAGAPPLGNKREYARNRTGADGNQLKELTLIMIEK